MFYIFRDADELILINGTFLPSLEHKKVLEMFQKVPVDSHTRLSLVSIIVHYCECPYTRTFVDDIIQTDFEMVPIFSTENVSIGREQILSF